MPSIGAPLSCEGAKPVNEFLFTWQVRQLKHEVKDLDRRFGLHGLDDLCHRLEHGLPYRCGVILLGNDEIRLACRDVAYDLARIRVKFVDLNELRHLAVLAPGDPELLFLCVELLDHRQNDLAGQLKGQSVVIKEGRRHDTALLLPCPDRLPRYSICVPAHHFISHP